MMTTHEGELHMFRDPLPDIFTLFTWLCSIGSQVFKLQHSTRKTIRVKQSCNKKFIETDRKFKKCIFDISGRRIV